MCECIVIVALTVALAATIIGAATHRPAKRESSSLTAQLVVALFRGVFAVVVFLVTALAAALIYGTRIAIDAHRRRQPAALRVGSPALELVDQALVEIEPAPLRVLEAPVARQIGSGRRA